MPSRLMIEKLGRFHVMTFLRRSTIFSMLLFLFLFAEWNGLGTSFASDTELTWATKNPLPAQTKDPEVAVGPDSRIYVFGGSDGSDTFAITQVYDPIANSSALLAQMLTPRAGHGAVMSGGKFYAMGGYHWAVLDVNEEYDPSSDTWVTKAPMPTRRYMIGATGTVDGKVWVMGGQTDDSSVGGVFGRNGWYFLNNLQVYNPATNTWSSKAPMGSYRADLASVTLNGKIYAIGGYTPIPSWSTTNIMEEYDPATDTWTQKASMNIARGVFAAVVNNGRIYVCGGVTNPSGEEEFWQQSVEEYDPTTDTWTIVGYLPIPISNLGAAAPYSGSFYVLGGETDHNIPVNTVLQATIKPIYNICPLYDQTKAVKSGATVPIKLQLCDANGANLSSPDVVVHAFELVRQSTIVLGGVEDAGNANPDYNFRYDATLGGIGGGYIFNLKTKGLTTGTYSLHFNAGDDSTEHNVLFGVK
jgi:N-acetylneuraminic acid mutarotase